MSNDKTPVEDRAQNRAFFPSEYSLGQYVPPTSDYDGAEHDPITGGPRRILVIGTDERYLPLQGDVFFSTGNHPVEMFVPMLHLAAAGYSFDIATVSGNMVKLEEWAFPGEDEAIRGAFETHRAQLDRPAKLSDITSRLTADSDYAGVFIPGGHGATVGGIPTSPDVKAALEWALDNDRFIITLCHGPAALLAATKDDGTSRFAGYEVCVFPDALDTGANEEIGYIPAPMTWLVAAELDKQGVKVLNEDMTGMVHRDRLLLTGDSPLASNALGHLAVDALRGAYSSEQA